MGKHKISSSNYYNWSIEKGDYVRDHESTSGYESKVKRTKIISKLVKISLISSVLVIILFFIIKHF